VCHRDHTRSTESSACFPAAPALCPLSCYHPQVFACVSAPIDTHSLTVSILPLARSLECNGIGAEGATALAAVLNETKITNLKCAATPEVFTFVSAPIDTPSPILPLARSLRGNQIGAQGATALAAILNETKITNLKCAAAPKVFAFVSAPLDTFALSLYPPCPSFAVFSTTASVRKGRPSSRRC